MKAWIKKIFGFGLASLLSDMSHEMTIAFIPVLIVQFIGPDNTPLILGIIASITDAFTSLLRIGAGFLTDRISRKKPLIAVGYGMSALFSMLVGFSHSIGELLLYRMLSFSGAGIREPARDAVIATIVSPPEYGRAFGLRSAMDTIGSLLGPLIAFVCVGTMSMQHIFVISLIPGIISVGAIIFLTQETPVSQKKSAFPSLWKSCVLLPRSFIVFLIIIFIFDISCFNKLLLIARAREMLAPHYSAIPQLLVLLYAIFNATRACSEFIIGLLSDYVRPFFLLAPLGCGIFAVVAFLLTVPEASLSYCIGIFALSGISIAAITTLKKVCAAHMLPKNIRGFGYGVLQASEGFAALISSALIGFLWGHFSALIAFSYTIILSISAMLLLIIFGMLYSSPQSLSPEKLSHTQ